MEKDKFRFSLNRTAKNLLKQLCDCNTIDRSKEGQPCLVCGKRIMTKLEEGWLWGQTGLGHRVKN